VEIRQELAREKAQGEAAVQERIARLEATNTALQEAMNERVAIAEQQARAASSQYEALAADQETDPCPATSGTGRINRTRKAGGREHGECQTL
jgi:phytoene/squalene synthetase